MMKHDDSPSFNYTDHTILNLNDDCLCEIFSYLTFHSLWRVGATCVRLSQVAQQLYSRYYADLDVNKHLWYDTKTNETMLQEIGSHVKSVDFKTNDSEDNLPLVLKYCTNLCELKLMCSLDDAFSDDEIREMFKSPIFQNLQSVKLLSNLIDIPEILGSMKNLKKLDFSTSDNEIKSSEFLKLRNLDTLSLDLAEPIDFNIYSGIFDNNLQLKKFCLNESNPGDQIIHLICDKLVYLEDLDFKYDPRIIPERTFMRIAELKNLTHFKRFWPKCLLEKLADADMLESLYYTKDLGESVTKFTKLKYLALSSGDDVILNSLKSQGTLEDLDISDNESITVNGLVKFIEGAKNLKRLTICNCDEAFDENILHRINDQIGKFYHGKLTIVCDFPVNQKYRNLIVQTNYNSYAESSISSDFDSDFS